MASALLGKLKSRVKGHHVFQSNYTIGDNFVCSPEPDNDIARVKMPLLSRNQTKMPSLVTYLMPYHKSFARC